MTVNRAPNACAYFLRMRTSGRKREREEEGGREGGREGGKEAENCRRARENDMKIM